MMRRRAKYKRYFSKMVRTLPTFMIGPQIYVNRPSLSFLAAHQKRSKRYNKRLPHTTGLFTVMNVKIHVITIDKNGTLTTISTNGAMPVPTKIHRATRIIPNLHPPARTTALHNKYTNRNRTTEYVVDKVLDHRHRSEHLKYKIC